jgi:hypothetical protein
MMSVLCILVLISVAAAITIGDVPINGIGVWGATTSALSVGSFWLASGYSARSPWLVKDEKPADTEREAATKTEGHSLREALWKAAGAGSVIFVADTPYPRRETPYPFRRGLERAWSALP